MQIDGNIFHQDCAEDGRWSWANWHGDEGVLKDSMKLNLEGKTLPIEHMGRRNAQSPRAEWLKEAKEKEIVQVMLKGADFESIKKYQGKNVEFA